MLTFGSLFAGIGGMDLGLERAGMACRWQVEIDEHATGTLERHWPTVARYRDVRTVSQLEPVDLVCAGFPCQPVSVAGKRAAQGDSRWLWPEVVRLVRSVGPRYVLLENVTGLLSAGFGHVLGDLASLGFDAEWSVLSACALGAPHSRERVFVVAHANGERRPELHIAALAAEQGRLGRAPAEGRSFWEAEPQPAPVADGLPSGLDVKGYGNAVVPQVAEWIGRRIIEADTA